MTFEKDLQLRVLGRIIYFWLRIIWNSIRIYFDPVPLTFCFIKWQNTSSVVQSDTLANESPPLIEMDLPIEVIPEVKTEPIFDHSIDQSDISSNGSVIVIGSTCPVCLKQFATKNNCRRHVREMHNKNPVSRSRSTQNNNKE